MSNQNDLRLLSQIIIVLFASLLIVFISAGLNFQFLDNPDNKRSETSNDFFCGTEFPEYTEDASEGKKIYNINCAACHRMDSAMTGPALREFLVNRELPYPDYYFDFLTKDDSLIKNDNTFTNAINDEYEYNYSHNFELTKTEIENLFEYINVN